MQIPGKLKDYMISNKTRKWRKELTNKDFSIICDTCVGGVLYHWLGLPFLSPTINLWMMDDEFYKFVRNLREYLSMDLRFIKSEFEYPVAQLDDIHIYFQHYHSNDEAERDWNKRKQRINWENLFIICADNDGITDEDIKSLDAVKCAGKVVFSPREIEGVEYLKRLSICEGQTSTGTYMLNNRSALDKLMSRYMWTDEFDFVRFFNTGKVV